MSETRTVSAQTGSRTARSLPRYAGLVGDVVLTTLLPPPSVGAAAWRSAGSGSRSYRRAHRVAAAVARWVPRPFAYLQRRLLNTDSLPFAAGPASVLSYGSGVTVFLLGGETPEEAGDRHVLKVFRKSLGLPLPALLEHVRQRQANYDRVRAWYGGCGVVLPTRFLVLHGPLRSRPAAACVQPFIAAPKQDVFHDLTEAELVARLRGSSRLRTQFDAFVERTLRSASEEAACIDLVGHGNLVLVGDGGESRLLLLDLGVYDFGRKAARSPAALTALESRIYYLRRVRDAIGG